MRIILPLSFLCFTVLAGHAVEFNSIGRKAPVTLSHSVDFTSYVDINLELNTENAAAQVLYLRMRYIIGADTLHDNLKVENGHSGLVKQLLLKEGERLTAQVFLNNADLDHVEGLEGAFWAGSNTAMKVATDLGKTSFVSNVWVREQNPLFRVRFEENGSRDVQLLFHLDGNFEFDKLHFKVKVISPEQGILLLSRSVKVTEDAYLNQRTKTLKVSLDGVNFSYPGSYYFQLSHEMQPEHVNGIEKISHEVVPL